MIFHWSLRNSVFRSPGLFSVFWPILTRLWSNSRIVDFVVSADHRLKRKGSEKRDKYLDLARELKKNTMEHEGDGDTNCNLHTRHSPQSIGIGTRGLGNKRTSADPPNYSIVEIAQNTKKSPGDLRRLAVTQTPVKDHQLVWKTLKSVI